MSSSKIQRQEPMDFMAEDSDTDPYLNALFKTGSPLIDPTTVEFKTFSVNSDLKSEEDLFLPLIEDLALAIAKIQSKLDTLTKKQALYELAIAQLELPNNAPKATRDMLKNCKSEAEQLVIVKAASAHLNQSERIKNLTDAITEHRDSYTLKLCIFAAKSGINKINFPISHATKLLEHAIKQHRVRFANTMRLQQEKADRIANSLKKETATPPTVDSLSKELEELKKLFNKDKHSVKKLKYYKGNKKPLKKQFIHRKFESPSGAKHTSPANKTRPQSSANNSKKTPISGKSKSTVRKDRDRGTSRPPQKRARH